MYTDVLVKIKNAQRADKEVVKVQYSTMDMAIIELLAKHKYVDSVTKKGRAPKRIIEIKLNGGLNDFKFISKPSRRLYFGYKDLHAVRQGYGVSVLSTPKGILTNREARKEKVGGEVLFEIW